MHNVVHQKGHDAVPPALHHSESDMPENVTEYLLSHICQSKHRPEMAALVNFTHKALELKCLQIKLERQN